MERKEMTTKNEMLKRFILVASAFVLIFSLVALAACQPTGTDTPATEVTPEEEVVLPTAATPTMDKNENGVWTAEAWKDIYPNEYETFMQNELNDTDGNASDPYFAPREDMVELYPMLKVIWNPSPFNTYYNEPNGHPYTLEDIRATYRLIDPAGDGTTYRATAFANCYTCKSADYTAILNDEGVAAYNYPFGDAAITDRVVEPISCYNCHENNLATDSTASSVKVTQPFFVESMGSSNIDLGSQSCGQCHNEYYFKPSDRSVTNPYDSVDNMTAEDMYEYYKTAGKDGAPFADFTNPLTGVAHLKGQHPEFEFYFGDGGSKMTRQLNPATGETFGCVDCHMGNKVVGDDGVTYTSHLLISPLDNEELLTTTCNTAAPCHTDLATQVEAWQKESEDDVMAIGEKLEDLNVKLADAVANGTLSEADLAAVRELNRQSQWYWDFVMVENSEGVHNMDLSRKLLGLSEDAVDEALAYF
jgi:nitrite reductase (cytochrome c-552)